MGAGRKLATAACWLGIAGWVLASTDNKWSELQGIASPLRSLRQSCPQQVSPGDVARLYDAMAS